MPASAPKSLPDHKRRGEEKEKETCPDPLRSDAAALRPRLHPHPRPPRLQDVQDLRVQRGGPQQPVALPGKREKERNRSPGTLFLRPKAS